jgi:hypothetical protein
VTKTGGSGLAFGLLPLMLLLGGGGAATYELRFETETDGTVGVAMS